MLQEYSEDDNSSFSGDSVKIEEELASLEAQINRETVEVVENELLTFSAIESLSGSTEACSSVTSEFKCSTCAKTFFELEDLIRHIEAHNRWRFKCAVCGKYFPSKSSLSVHGKRHREDRSFQCAVCKKSFIASADLHNHEKIHEDKQIRYSCNVCGKDFGRIYTLRSHMNLHEAVPQFKCGKCDKIFPKRRNLLLHQRTHLVEDSQLEDVESP